jgi:hypothetical protein
MAAAPAAAILHAYQRKCGPRIAPCCLRLAVCYAQLSTRTSTRTTINTAAINSHVSSSHLPTSRLPPHTHLAPRIYQLAPRIYQLAPRSYQLVPRNSRLATLVWNPRKNRNTLSSMDPYQTLIGIFLVPRASHLTARASQLATRNFSMEPKKKSRLAIKYGSLSNPTNTNLEPSKPHLPARTSHFAYQPRNSHPATTEIKT